MDDGTATAATGGSSPGVDADERTPAAALELPLAGAPLDLIKLAAALSMLGDHVNTVVLHGGYILLWRFGRIAFPLFCFVVAYHVRRGAEPRRYLSVLLLFAAATQPVFSWAFRNQLGNVLFTLAAGAAIASAMPRLGPWARHAVFALGSAVALAAPAYASVGVDFGLAGMLFPAVILAVLSGRPAFLPWLLVLTFALNWAAPRPAGQAWWYGPAIDSLFASLGSLAVLGLAVLIRGRPRFLPRFALHVFYPSHLGALAALRALL